MNHLDRLAVGLLVVLLTWLSIMGSVSRDQGLRATARALSRFDANEMVLRRDILRARAGLLSNYDPLDAALGQMNEAIRALEEVPDAQIIRPIVQEMDRRLHRQQALTDHFKTRDALVRNSVSYLRAFRIDGSAPGGERLRRRIDRMMGAMLNLTIDADPDARRAAHASLIAIDDVCEEVECSSGVRRLSKHGYLLTRTLPEMAGTIGPLVHHDDGSPAALRKWIAIREGEAATRANRYRILLYATSLVLLYLLVRWGLRVRAHSAALTHQLKLERAIARLSTRLIASPLEQIDGVIADALGDLATILGGERAFLRLGCSNHVYQWPSDGIGPPADLFNRFGSGIACEEQGTRQEPEAGQAQWSSIDGALTDTAGRGERPAVWLCLARNHQNRPADLLCFGISTEARAPRSSDRPMLQAAQDAMLLAINRAEAERERRRLDQQLSHARRMETVGAITSGIAHNFNNLLGAISGQVEMAQAQTETGAAVSAHLEQIRLSSDRGRDLVESLLSYGRRTEVRVLPFLIDPLVEESCGLARAIGKSPVVFCPGAGEVSVMGDATQIQQAILNLCRNAADASAADEEVLVSTRVIDRGVEIHILDRGGGIAPEVADRLFEPFFTTRAMGTGLGLFTAKATIEEYGGKLTLESVPGQGTDAIIQLPISETRAARADVPATGLAILLFGSGKSEILAAEDLLAALGHEPVGFTHIQRAQLALQDDPMRFDMLMVLADPYDPSVAALLAIAARVRPAMPRILACRLGQIADAAQLSVLSVTDILEMPLRARSVSALLGRLMPDAGSRAAEQSNHAAAL